jgi:SprT protein
MTRHNELLKKYIPENAVPLISEWISANNIYLCIVSGRSTKHGDYHPPIKHNYHKITINHDLNKYAFLITLVHEIAHLRVWEKYKNNVKPHGVEWKDTFKDLLKIFTDNNVFPVDLHNAILKYFTNPKASTSSDLNLSRVLRRYDKPSSLQVLEDIPENSFFRLKNGRTFSKERKLKKRYRCICLDTKRVYLIHPLIEVIPIK